MRGRVCACMRVRFNYCKRYIKQKPLKNQLLQQHHQKTRQKTSKKIHHFKKTLKKSVFTRVK